MSSSRPSGSSSSRSHHHKTPTESRRGAGSREQHNIELKQMHSALQHSDRTNFICKMKFTNETPELPYDLKFLAYPFDPDRLTRYQPTMLEKMHKYSLLTEPDLGIHIDLIEPEAYEPPENGAELLPEDAELVAEEEKVKKPSTMTNYHKDKHVPFLHKTAYYGLDDLYGMNQGGRARQELPVPIQSQIKDLTPQELVAKIEESFVIINGSSDELTPVIKHPTNPLLTATAVWSVMPNFNCWANDYTELVFDHDPVLDDSEVGKIKGSEGDEKRARLAAHALVHLHQARGKKNFSYMVPAPGSLKRKKVLDPEIDDDDMEEGTQKLQCLREYTENESRMHQDEWNNDHFVFSLDGDGDGDREDETRKAVYLPIKARTHLRKDKLISNLDDALLRNLQKTKGMVYPKHDEAAVEVRALTEAETQEMREVLWSVEGDPLAMHGKRAAEDEDEGDAGGAGEDDSEDGDKTPLRSTGGGGGRRVESSSSSSSSSDDERPATSSSSNRRPAPADSDDSD